MITVLAGGVGAARFLQGMIQIVPPESITVIVNTGDDFQLHGLHIAPDLDIVTCALANCINEEQGWGIRGDTFQCLDWLDRLGAPTWFRLGDRDLALHIQRTELLRTGHTLSDVADQFRRALGVWATVLPMSNQPAPTHIVTDNGEMHFEEYLVKHQATPDVRGVRFVGIEETTPAPGVLEAITDARLLIIAPSNPVASIGPILAVPGVRAAMQEAQAPVIGVSPIVGGQAVKGPAVELLRATGVRPSVEGVASTYRDMLSALVIDQIDEQRRDAVEAVGVRAHITNTMMHSLDDKIALAQFVLDTGGYH